MKLFIFGSTGDLVRRKVFPELQKIENIDILALGRKELTSKEYLDSINQNSEDLRKRAKYLKIDLESIPEEIFDKKNLIYIAMPPEWVLKILTQLTNLKNIEFQILIEKPFGSNLNEALKLKEFIKTNKLENRIFLSDHYLFKKNSLNLGKRNFHKLRIVSIEEISLGKRIENYDRVGALKDMVQSHFLNLVFKLVKNPETEFKNIKILEFEKGQYEDYNKEVGRNSETETFVRIKFETKNKLFEFVSGKAFDRKISYIEIDNEKIDLLEDNNSYKILFEKFINKEKKYFPTIDNAIIAWKIIEKIEKNKAELRKYPNGKKYIDI